jgi:2-polyprenyl-6-hydroxyphenyl methylase/3-demethylubiquinone-9 3-methyltransferase
MPSVDTSEIAKFGRLAAAWWDPAGPMRPLHAMNPLRVEWIGGRLAAGARLLDLGCGAGIAAEAFARRGFDVLGVDASAEAIAAGRAHAAGKAAAHGLALAYRCGAAEDLVAEGLVFDAVTALEVIEHVQDQAAFMTLLAALVRPGGMVFVSTLNRTVRSLAVAKVGAEYIARVLPAGTHDWRRFVPPDALAGYARAAGLVLTDITGMAMAPGGWRATRDVGVNYLAAMVRA